MLSIETLSAFSDNYIWLMTNSKEKTAAVVDPGDFAPVIKRLQQTGLTLCDILVTHHHQDHTGGITALKKAYPKARLYGPSSRINGFDAIELNRDSKPVILGESFSIIQTPGHTLDHICYFAQLDQGPPILFSGDTLFSGGCGRIFEGTPTQMFNSLQSLTQLPSTTQIYCAHEYTLANLIFAQKADQHNLALHQRQVEVQNLRAQNKPSIPTTLAIELATNPFLRCHSLAVGKSVSLQTGLTLKEPESVFTELRAWKDRS